MLATALERYERLCADMAMAMALATATMRAVDLSVSIKFSEVVIVIAAVILEGDLCEVIIVIGLRLA